MYMRDFLARNDLLQTLQFSDPEIINAMELAVDMFNIITPITSIAKVESFPNRYLLLLGTVSNLLTGEALANIRNQLSYSDGGIQVDVDNKMSAYLEAGRLLSAQFQEASDNYKKQVNAEQAFGGISSGYEILPIL